jgi:osmotically-inducible protein OsmY
MKPTLTDMTLREAVLKELDDDPEVDAANISVTALDGAIALGGQVATYHEKHEAVRAAERVPAVQAVADDIAVSGEVSVEPSPRRERSDDDIAKEIANRRSHDGQSLDAVGVQVRDGRVILHGEAESESHRDFADRAAHELAGVRAVADLIKVKAPAEPIVTDVERLVHDAIARVAAIDAGAVRVAMTDGTVHLEGRVPSLAALEAAMHAAETAPGVTAVESEIAVSIQTPATGSEARAEARP